MDYDADIAEMELMPYIKYAIPDRPPEQKD